MALRRSNISRSTSLVRRLHDLRIGVLNETKGQERRVALVPKHVETLVGKGAAVQVVKNAGVAAGYSNEMYEKAGASVVDAADVWKNDMVLAINQPARADLEKLQNRGIIAQLQPLASPEVVEQLASQGATALSLDMLLRTLSRGQAFDVLSSQANCAGYRAVVEAGYLLGRLWVELGSVDAGKGREWFCRGLSRSSVLCVMYNVAFVGTAIPVVRIEFGI